MTTIEGQMRHLNRALTVFWWKAVIRPLRIEQMVEWLARKLP